MDGFNRDARDAGAGHGRAVEDQRAVRHVARRRRARRRLDRRREARLRHARAALEGRARASTGSPARCSTAHRRCRTRRSTTSRAPRRPRSTSRRTSRTCCSITCPAELRERDLRVAAREREGRAEGDGLRRAVLLQDAQEGARPVQAALLGPAGRREGASSATAYDEKFEFLFTQLGDRRHGGRASSAT